VAEMRKVVNKRFAYYKALAGGVKLFPGQSLVPFFRSHAPDASPLRAKIFRTVRHG